MRGRMFLPQMVSIHLFDILSIYINMFLFNSVSLYGCQTSVAAGFSMM